MKHCPYPKALFIPFLTAVICLAGCATKDNPTDPGIPGPSTEWRLVESGITNTVRAMATNDTMVVAVGDGGIIFSSTDGCHWTEQRENGPNDALSDIVWTGDQFIVVGWNATLISSPDGITWTWIGIDPHSHLYSVAASDTLLIAVGSSSNVYSSRDGIEWSPLNTGITEDVFAVNYANDLWLIGAGNGQCYRSVDGITWAPASLSPIERRQFVAFAASDSLFYGLTRYYSSGWNPPLTLTVRCSSNGSNWFSLGNLDAWNIWDICWTGSELVAVGEGTNYHLGMPDGLVFSSTGGADFVEHITEAPFALAAAETFNGELLVGGSGGYILGGSQADDLSVRTSGAGITGIVWNGSEYVAVTARGTIMRSPDGENWSETHSRVSTQFERLAFSGEKYVTLGGLGAPLDIYTSADADTWTRTQTFEDVVLKDVTWGGGNFVVCAQKGSIYLSTDGETWDRHFVGDSVQLRSICYDGDRYLAAARDSVYTSNNGIDWTKPTVDPADTRPIIESLIWTGMQYAAVGSDSLGYVYTSSDAVHWTEHELGPQDFLNDIAWTGRQYIVCGRSGTLLTSSDANSWISVATGTEHTLLSIETHDDQAVVVGAYRTVLVQP